MRELTQAHVINQPAKNVAHITITQINKYLYHFLGVIEKQYRQEKRKKMEKWNASPKTGDKTLKWRETHTGNYSFSNVEIFITGT